MHRRNRSVVAVLLPVAATDTDPGGFSWTQDGELVYPAWVCTDEDPYICGCGRAFAGLDSHRATTLAVIHDIPISVHNLRQAVARSLARGGWVHPANVLDPLSAQDGKDLVAEVTTEMVEIGETFGDGVAIVRILDDILPAL